MEGTESLKQSLLDNYKEVVEKQNILKNRSLAFELGSIISRMFPGKATDRKIEVITRDIKAQQKSKSETAKRSAPESSNGSRVFMVRSDAKKKVRRESEEVVVAKGSRLRKEKTVDEIKPGTTTANGVNFDGKLKDLLELTPSELETKLGGFDGMKEFAKVNLGLKFTNQNKASVGKMIFETITNLNVSDTSEEE